jgi:four helix bundle protein
MAATYRSLTVWQLAMDLAEEVYRLSRQFPREEQFGLTSQIRRAAVSIPSNIAEGHGRGADAEFRQFLVIARGSLREVETQVALATRLGFHAETATKTFEELAGRVARMLTSLIQVIETAASRSKREARSAKLAARSS